MSMKYLGESFDIHTSSRELIFPHHENELAIAKAVTGKPLSRYWIDCEGVMVGDKKMDEKGTKLTLQDLLDTGYSGREIRYWLLSAHYRKPITFSKIRLLYSKKSLNRLDACIQGLLNVKKGSPFPELDHLLYDIKQNFINAMDDDLNISAAMASVFKSVKKINILIAERRLDPDDASKIIEAFRNIDSVLNIFDLGNKSYDPEIQQLLREREKARQEKNWTLADKLRDDLKARGIRLQDKKI